MKLSGSVQFLLLSVLVVSSAVRAYEVEYRVELVPAENQAKVTLQLQNVKTSGKGRAVKEISFDYQASLHSDFKANGKLKIDNDRVSWSPPSDEAWLSLKVNLLHERDSDKNKGEFDSYINDDWAIFRGDDLFPSASVTTVKDAKATTRLEFILPKNWKYVNTGWERDKTPGRIDRMGFFVDDPDRNFDRPTGWMIAGDIATRRDLLGETVVSVTGPKRASFKDGVILERMEIMTFLNFVWPHYQKLLPEQPPKLLIVGAGEPMWRGGLSGPNNLFLHADRPLVSENGTSTLLHEVFHSLTRIRGEASDDWISEGLAEYYSVKLVYSAGGMTEERFNQVFAKLQARSKKVKTLRKKNSRGATTAKAALVFRDLDREISTATGGKASLDEVVKKLVEKRKVNLRDLQNISHQLIKADSKVLAQVQ